MNSQINDVLRRQNNCVHFLAMATLAIGLSLPSAPTNAQTQISLQLTPMVVLNDRGGLLHEKLRQLRQLRRSNQPVRITGAICYSTCTLYLGLPQTCVSPNTIFGFHGPSSYGRALSPKLFERTSRLVASQYPRGLKQWYLNTGRFKIGSLYKMKGSQIINMGVRAC